MKQAILLAGAAVLAFSAPAYSKPDHANHGKGHAPAAVQGNGAQYGKGLGGCPPGHAKHPGVCMPHGQWKKQFEVGQRVPLGYRGLLGYNSLPYDVRNHYGRQLDPYGRYIYDNNYVYRVDPTTMVVSEVLRSVLR